MLNNGTALILGESVASLEKLGLLMRNLEQLHGDLHPILLQVLKLLEYLYLGVLFPVPLDEDGASADCLEFCYQFVILCRLA